MSWFLVLKMTFVITKHILYRNRGSISPPHLQFSGLCTFRPAKNQIDYIELFKCQIKTLPFIKARISVSISFLVPCIGPKTISQTTFKLCKHVSGNLRMYMCAFAAACTCKALDINKKRTNFSWLLHFLLFWAKPQTVSICLCNPLWRWDCIC